MYLSKVFLHPGRLNNAYEWHRALWSLFPDVPRGETSPFIYMVESLNLAHGATVLMQSTLEPISNSAHADVKAVKAIHAKLHDGQRLAFRITANPTRCITDQEDKLGKKNRGKSRVPLIREEEQVGWLERKLAGAASLHEVAVTPNPPIYFRKGSRAGKVVPVTYEGVLNILNVEKLGAVWQNGVGPAKAFGCGMLLVRRA